MHQILYLVVFLFTLPLAAQLPAFENTVLDINTDPRLQDLSETENYFPLQDDEFFFGSSTIYHFNGEAVVVALEAFAAKAEVHERYAGGLLLYAEDGPLTGRTYHLDPLTYDTTFLARGRFEIIHTTDDGLSIIRSDVSGPGRNYSVYYSIGNDPSALLEMKFDVDTFHELEAVLNDRVIVNTIDGLVATDGTASGTAILTEEVPDGDAAAAAGVLLFETTEDVLMETDGTPQGTRFIAFDHLPRDQRPLNTTTSYDISALHSGPVFVATSLANGRMLWYRDSRIRQYLPLTPIRGNGEGTDSLRIFRQRDDLGKDLLITDGTSDGTRTLLDLGGGDISNNRWGPEIAAELPNGDVVFTTDYVRPPFHWYLRPGGTPIQIALPDYEETDDLRYLSNGNELYLTVNSGDSGLFRYNSEDESLEKLAPFAETTNQWMPLDDGGIVLHGKGEDGGERTIIHYRGTTTTVPGFLGLPGSDDAATYEALSFQQDGDLLYGIGIDEEVGEAVFSYNINASEKRVLVDLYPFTLSSDPENLRAGDLAAFFSNGGDFYGSYDSSGYELLIPDAGGVAITPITGTGLNLLRPENAAFSFYVSDGSEAGTRKLNRYAGTIRGEPLAVNGQLYFIATRNKDPETYGYQLVRLDPTEGNYEEVFSIDIQRDSFTYHFQPSIGTTGEQLYFPVPVDGGRDWEIWTSDGTTNGTRRFSALPESDVRLFPYEFRSDGGLVTYHLRDAYDVRAEPTLYLIFKDDAAPTSLENTVTNGDINPTVPLITPTGVLLATEGGLRLLEDDGTAVDVWTCDGCYPQALTRVDDNTYLFSTKTDNRFEVVHRLMLDTRRVDSLLDRADLTVPYNQPVLRVLDSLLLVPGRLDEIATDELLLVNVLTGDVTVATEGNYSIIEVRDLVVAGNRFLYIDDNEVYGKEVFTLTFPDYPARQDIISSTEEGARTRVLAVSVYPNPTQGTINVRLPAPAQRYGYTLFDNQGREVLHGEWNTDRARLDLPTNLPPGAYHLRVIDPSNRQTGLHTFILH